MKKFIIYIIFFLFLNACYRIPQREEIEYRNNLENAIVETFPKKVIIVIHPFKNLSPSDTNRAYLEAAIPDSIEAMLEPLRSTLAYIPFEGMPFYVSQEISNLFQTVETNEDDTNSSDEDEDEDNEDEDEDEDEEDKDNEEDEDDEEDEDSENATNDADDSYFTYLTNYLLVVPTQETQYDALTTTNTNYYDIITNTRFENGQEITNFTSNEILLTTTNEIHTNVAIVNKNILTPTNMLLLLYEEFPELTNYLSFLPIEIRRANDSDIESFKDYKLKIDNPTQWRRQQQQKEREALKLTKENSNMVVSPEQIPEYPSEEFEYFYHINGNFRTRNSQSIIQPVQTDILMQIYPPESTGNTWWQERHKSSPPSLSNILNLVASLDSSNSQEFKDNFIRTPFKKPDVSPRLQDEFDTYSTNFIDFRPETPARDLTIKNKPLSLRLNVSEDEIPMAMIEWLKYFHATIVNRPYTVLKVSSTPNTALVYLNGFFIGTTPLTYPTAPIGQQRIRFLKEGFNREEILADIIPNQTNNIYYSMTSLNNSGTLALTASIPDAEIYVNSQYKGQTPLIISNLSLNTKYRIEILDPSANLTSNRNSVYKDFTLTSKKSSISFDAQFKTYETVYRTPAQQGLLAATYISWFTTIGLFGTSIYAHARNAEAQALISQFGTPTGKLEEATLKRYQDDVIYFRVVSDATLYSAIAGAILSTGIMGWYLYSKEIYLGMDVDPEKNEWYVNFKLKF